MKRSKYDLTENIKPETDHKYVGIEIEFCTPCSFDEVLDQLVRYNLHDHSTLKGDGSICPDSTTEPCGDCWGCDDGGRCAFVAPHDGGYELCLLVKESELVRVLELVAKVFKHVRAYANNSCGLHVHLDMRYRDAHQAFKNLIFVQDLLYGMCPKSRKTNGYCKPTKDKTIDAAIKKGRYQGINPCSLGKHRTIEVRIHHGTVNTDEIKVWTQLLISSIESKSITKVIKTTKELKEVVSIPDTVSEALEAKAKQYAKEHGSAA